MNETKTIALVAHDACKADLVAWVEFNYKLLMQHHLICTGTTGMLVEGTLAKKLAADGAKIGEDLGILKLKSGPLGGDQQIGAMIAEGKIDVLIFFWDPMEPHPHEVDVKALLRIAVVYNIPVACNRSSADFMVSSQLMQQEYTSVQKDYGDYLKRSVVPPSRT